MKKVLVWLSGWVDSAVSAYLLKKDWYDIVAWFMINYLADKWEYCQTKEDIKVAKEVALFLKIPFFIFDYKDIYSEKVLKYMYDGYKKWITPNPDIMCNSEIKFKIFLNEALEHNFDYIAMWHYAIIEKNSNWLFDLKKARDNTKDQSYFLAWLNQFQLSKSLFPIWKLKKFEVRQIAQKIWLPNAKRKDSQWICFVWKVNLTKFLEKKINNKVWIVKNTLWEVIWKHNWVFYYTIWQRKWVNIWWQTEPIFVIKKDIKNNELIVWNKNDIQLYDNKLIILDFHFLWKKDFIFPLNVKCKIRYRQPNQECVIYKQDNNYKILFKNKQRAITSGQICAVYLDDILIMSWVIF